MFYNDDDVSLRIVDGFQARSGQFPYMASLILNNTFQCGGTIITRQWILTASHCFIDQETQERYAAEYFEVTVGDIYWRSGRRNSVLRYLTHAKYNGEHFNNDIALAQVKWPFKFDYYSQPIKLNRLPVMDHLQNLSVITAGWGFYVNPNDKEESESESPVLLTVHLKTIPMKLCKEHFEAEALPSTKICVSSATRKGTCQGDSGGPLIYNNKQIGVVSSGYPCPTDIPELYTRISSFFLWIRENIRRLTPGELKYLV
nr:chymotrypsin-1-like [Onthophagus taurus]